MSDIEFVGFSHLTPEDLLTVVNDETLRKHLIDHPIFDASSLRLWMEDKVKTGSLPGCRIRAIYIDEVLAGWCGIQPDDKGFEIAIVIAKEFWGFGIPVFQKMMLWAKELGHKEIMFHLLETRPEYRSLKRKATKVKKTELYGRSFITYYISVDKWCA